MRDALMTTGIGYLVFGEDVVIIGSDETIDCEDIQTVLDLVSGTICKDLRVIDLKSPERVDINNVILH